MNVKSKPCLRRRGIKYPCLKHRLSSRKAFLIGLEHKLYGSAKLVFVLHEQPCSAKQHCGVHIVSAGMHTSVFRPEIKLCKLGHLQGVHISAKHDATVGFLSGNRSHNSALADLTRLIPHLAQSALYIFLCMRQTDSHLRIFV